MLADAEIFAPIVERIPVDMIDDRPVWRAHDFSVKRGILRISHVSVCAYGPSAGHAKHEVVINYEDAASDIVSLHARG